MNEIEQFFDRRASDWDSLHRRQDFETIERVFSRISITKEDYILDVGAGTGILAPYLIETGCRFTALDLSGKMLEMYRKKFPSALTVQGDYEKDDLFADNSFTKIIIYNSFPHFTNPFLVFEKAHAHLAEGGGLIIFQSMNRLALDQKHRSVGGTVARHSLYPDADLLTALSHAGFAENFILDEDFFLLQGRKKKGV